MNNVFEFIQKRFSDIDSTQTGLMDAATNWQLSFSDPATPIMEGIINFHNDLMFFYSSNYYFCFMDVNTLYYDFCRS